MIPWVLIDETKVPGSKSDLRLYRRGDEYSIRIDNAELMNSRMHGSEEALAELAFARIAAHRKPRILIGGLGMGFTLAAVLRHLPKDGEAVVSELVPSVVVWNRGPLGPLAGNPLNDRRVKIREDDVVNVIAGARDSFDAILLDVDNGPEALTHVGNQRLYGPSGLRAAHSALRAGGVLSIWSTGASPLFSKRLKQAHFEVEEVRARARGDRGGARHLIWIATKQR